MKLQNILDFVAPPRVVFKATVADEIQMAANPLIMAPLHGVFVPLVGHELSDGQIEACGDFSLIQASLEPERKLTREETKEILAMQRKVCEAWMLRPTYAELLDLVGVSPAAVGAKEKLLAMERRLWKMRKDKEDTEAQELLEEIELLEMFADCILPSGFTAFVFGFAVGINKTDIQNVTDRMCLEAAHLAVLGHDNPHDHVGGLFTKFNEKDIDRRSWYLLELEREGRDLMKEAKHAG